MGTSLSEKCRAAYRPCMPVACRDFYCLWPCILQSLRYHMRKTIQALEAGFRKTQSYWQSFSTHAPYNVAYEHSLGLFLNLFPIFSLERHYWGSFQGACHYLAASLCLPCSVSNYNATTHDTTRSPCMHVNTHYTPSTTHSAAFHNPPMHTTYTRHTW